MERAALEVARGDYAAALQTYSEFIATCPTNCREDQVQARCALAGVQLELGMVDDAEQSCNAALAVMASGVLWNDAISRDQVLWYRASARKQLFKFALAAEDFEACPLRRERALKQAVECRRLLAAEARLAQAERFSQEKQPCRLGASPMRLHLQAAPPASLVPGQTYELRLFVLNEFGTCLRETTATQHWKLKCELLDDSKTLFCSLEVAAKGFSVAGRIAASIKLPVSAPIIAKAFLRFSVDDHVEIMPLYARVQVSHAQDRDAVVASKAIASCYRSISISPSVGVLIGEANSELGIPGKVWDGAFGLLSFLLDAETRRILNLDFSATKRIVELGAGTGLVGISLAASNVLPRECDLVITDLPFVLPLIQENIEINQLKGVCRAYALPWGDPSACIALGLQPDLTIMSDVVYDKNLYGILVETLRTLQPSRLFMAHRNRFPDEPEFFELMTKEGYSTVALVRGVGDLSSVKLLDRSRQFNMREAMSLVPDVWVFEFVRACVRPFGT